MLHRAARHQHIHRTYLESSSRDRMAAPLGSLPMRQTSNGYNGNSNNTALAGGTRESNLNSSNSSYLQYRRRMRPLIDDMSTDDSDYGLESEDGERLERQHLQALLEREQSRIFGGRSTAMFNGYNATASEYEDLPRIAPLIGYPPPPPPPPAVNAYQAPLINTSGSTTQHTQNMSRRSSLSDQNGPSSDPQNGKSAPAVKLSKLEIFLGPRLNLLLAICKALSLPPSIYGIISCLLAAWTTSINPNSLVHPIELLLATVWAVVAGYFAYVFIDGLMLRWLVTYSFSATILRLVSINTLMGALTRIILSLFANDPIFYLPTWILISCILTAAYAIQSFVTSNIAIEPRARRVDLYHIAVFAVVPVGLASFTTMIGLIWCFIGVRSS
ncbi:N-glycosylation protein-domain-containing protein [Dipodascopsis uninucleata]